MQYSRSIWIHHNGKKTHVFQGCSADTRRRIMSPSLCRSLCRSSASQWERPSSVGRPTQSIPSPCSPPLSWRELRERRWVSDGITSPLRTLRFAFFKLFLRSCYLNLPEQMLFQDWGSASLNVTVIIFYFTWLSMAGVICTIRTYLKKCILDCQHGSSATKIYFQWPLAVKKRNTSQTADMTTFGLKHSLLWILYHKF